MTRKSESQKRAEQISRGLKREYPQARIALNYSNPLELLIATILSAQCTDERVNRATPALFRKYRAAGDYAAAAPAVFEKEIHATGFFRQKTKSILGACKAIVERHGGQLPSTMEELSALPGVGRKTANVVLGAAFGKPAIVVDTHVRRLAQRLGLTRQNDPGKIELDLQGLLPEKEWTGFSTRLILHGRRICAARAPKCPACFARPICPSRDKFVKKRD